MAADRKFDTDVLVIGCGPMGGTTALALATYGIDVMVVNKYNWTANTPRAHITNQRALEVLRDLGVEQDVHKYATPWRTMNDTYFMTSLAGRELARLRSWGTGEDRASDYLQMSPCQPVDIPQDRLEPILVRHAAERGAVFRFNTEYLSHEQDAEGVTVRVRDVVSGAEGELRCRYLVGADGARSKVMEDAGLELEGHLGRAATVYVRFKADLSRYVAHRPGILYWVASPEAAYGEIGMGLLRAVEPWTTWIAGWGVDKDKGAGDLQTEEVADRIRRLIGDPAQKIEILNISTWFVNQAWAPRYSSGRVFCGGDAVHRHPPSNGLGSNTSIQDGFCLAWKLAYVIKGLAASALLETYTVERAPVGKEIVLRANKSRLEYAAFARCFRDATASSPLAEGLRKLSDPGPEGVSRRADLHAAIRLKDFDYNAQGVELNQRYVSSAMIPDDNPSPEFWRRDREVFAQPSTRPGAKIPHAWLVGREGERVSTLDLTGKGWFTLVTGIAGIAWEAAVAGLNHPMLRTLVIGRDGAQDCYTTWHEVREIDEAGALLVRPDGVIAWRHLTGVESPEDASALLKDALGRVLGR